MHITYLHQYFNTPAMPGSTRSYELGRRLVAMGHEVNMVTSFRGANHRMEWFESEEAGMRLHWLPIPYSNRMSHQDRIRAFLRFAYQSASKAASFKADVIFATSTPLTIALPAVHAAKRQKVPMVFEVRDLWPEMPIAMGALRNPVLRSAARCLEKWAYRHSAAIVALSPSMKSGIARSGFPEERIGVIPNGSDNAEFAHNEEAGRKFRGARPWLQNKPLLLYLGTLGKVNGAGYAVDLAVALQQLKSDIRILLIGDGVEREMIKDAAVKRGVLGQNLFLEPQIEKREVLGALSAATTAANFVIDLPEARKNSANKFFDTLAAGKPIFLNHGGWMHDLVLLHRCGFPMWRKPMSEVAAELHFALHDLAWLAQAGSEARQLAEKYFDRDILANQFEQLLVAATRNKADTASKIAPGYYC
jgi:glycosyltransferase involved in cell wall biosynthesis